MSFDYVACHFELVEKSKTLLNIYTNPINYYYEKNRFISDGSFRCYRM